MFVRVKELKTARVTHQYLQIVESYRSEGRVRQRVIGTIGRLDRLLAKGSLDGLIKSLSKFSNELMVIQAKKKGAIEVKWDKEWGSFLVFRRIWEKVGLDRTISSYLDGRRYEFDVERAVFVCVLQRLIKPGSDLLCSKWLKDIYDEKGEEFSNHHLYRAMAFLDETKDSIEESLFLQGRNLFDYKVDLVFFDTTSIYFEGDGPDEFAKYGHSKDRRSDRKQIIVGVMMSRRGFPIGCEFWPGNISDLDTLEKVISSLTGKFHLGRVILVCDRGMVSENTLKDLEGAGMDYIVGVRMRKLKEVRDKVLSHPGRYHEVAGNLKVKEVVIGKKRYILCFNPEEAKRDMETRKAMVEKLRYVLSKQGPKAIVGNRGYKRFIRMEAGAVQIDERKFEEEARFDGKFVLYTNTDLPSDEVAMSYKRLWQVEHAFSDLKNILKVRPIYHRKAEHVKGHIFCNFLALYLKIAIEKELASRDIDLPWDDLLSDIRSFRAIKVNFNGQPFLLRTEFRRHAYNVFKAAGLRAPPMVQAIEKM